MFASFQSTSDPFIQILPVPEKAIMRWILARAPELRDDPIGSGRRPDRSLNFVAERAAIGSRVERFPALPAEPRGRCFTGAKTGFDSARFVLRVRCVAFIECGGRGCASLRRTE